jgi:hypothetical protein
MLPFTEPEFFAVFGRYNLAIWPVQIVACALALIAIGTLLVRTPWAASCAFAVLAMLWGWTGAVYHIGYFREINGAALLFGAGFILQALFFGHHALTTRPAFDAFDVRQSLGWIMIGYAAVLYPILNAWLGHAYPQAPSFGVTPCPLTIFTFGMMTLSRTRLPWRLYAIPAIWSAIGGSAAVLLGVAADVALPAAGLLALWLNARKPT